MTLNVLPLFLEAASKAFVYSALLIAAGACAVKWLLLTRAHLSAEEVRNCERRLARLLLTATGALAVALVLRLLAHTAAAFGLAESLSIESIRVVALESQWGEGWRMQLLAAAVAVSAAVLVRMQPRNGWVGATAAVMTCCLSVPLLGHAAGESGRLALHALHVGAAGLWLGSLAAIVIACRPRVPFLREFAPLALSGAALLSSSGVVIAWQYVGSVSNLWATAYGRALSLKLALVSAIVVSGYLNWRQWHPAITSVTPSDAEPPGSARIAVVELALALTVVLVTSLLSELEHP